MSQLGDLFEKGLRTFLEPLVPYWEDDIVAGIFINDPKDIWVEIQGSLEPADVSITADQLYQAIRHIAQLSGVLISEENPQLHTMLDDGTEISVILPPISRRGPVLAIHKATPRERTLDELVEEGVLSRAAGEFLLASLLAQQSMMIVGPPGSGKATLIRALVRYIPENERLVSIEQSTSHVFRHPHVLHFALPSSEQYQDKPSKVSQMLLRGLSSIRPHRILVERMGSRSTLDMMQIFRSGYPGSLATVRAFQADHALQRLEAQYLAERPNASLSSLRSLLSSTFQLAVVCRRAEGGNHVAEIAQFLPLDRYTGDYRWLPLFQRKAEQTPDENPAWEPGVMLPTGCIPGFWPTLQSLGFSTIDRAFFHPDNYDQYGERDDELTAPSEALLGRPLAEEAPPPDVPSQSNLLAALQGLLSQAPAPAQESAAAPVAPPQAPKPPKPPQSTEIADAFPFHSAEAEDPEPPKAKEIEPPAPKAEAQPVRPKPAPIQPPEPLEQSAEDVAFMREALDAVADHDDTERRPFSEPKQTVASPPVQEPPAASPSHDFGIGSVDIAQEALQPPSQQEMVESPFHQPDPPVAAKLPQAEEIHIGANANQHQATTVIAQVDPSVSARPKDPQSDWENVPTHNPTLPSSKPGKASPTTQTPPVSLDVEEIGASQIIEAEDTSQILDLSDIIVDELPNLVSEDEFRKVEEELRQQSPVRQKDPSTARDLGLNQGGGPSTRAGMLPSDEMPTANRAHAYLYTDEEPTQTGPSLSGTPSKPHGAARPSSPPPAMPPRRDPKPPHKPARSVVVRRGRRANAYDIGSFDVQETESTSIRARPPSVPKVSRTPPPDSNPQRNQSPPSVEVPISNNLSNEATVIRGRPVSPKKK